MLRIKLSNINTVNCINAGLEDAALRELVEWDHGKRRIT